MSDAHEAVRNLLGRYCELMDAGEFETLADLFADAVLTGPDGRPFARGRADVLQQWRQRVRLYDGSPRTRHLTTNTVIEVDRDAGTASARSAYVVFQSTDVLPLQPVITGRYHDRFVHDTDGGWRFAERRYFVDLLGDVSQHMTGA